MERNSIALRQKARIKGHPSIGLRAEILEGLIYGPLNFAQKDETPRTQRVLGRSPKQPSPKCCSKGNVNRSIKSWNGTNVLSEKMPTARSKKSFEALIKARTRESQLLTVVDNLHNNARAKNADPTGCAKTGV